MRPPAPPPEARRAGRMVTACCAAVGCRGRRTQRRSLQGVGLGGKVQCQHSFHGGAGESRLSAFATTESPGMQPAPTWQQQPHLTAPPLLLAAPAPVCLQTCCAAHRHLDWRAARRCRRWCVGGQAQATCCGQATAGTPHSQGLGKLLPGWLAAVPLHQTCCAAHPALLLAQLAASWQRLPAGHPPPHLR